MTDLADLNVPGPTVTSLTEPFWQAAQEGRLLIQYCGACHRNVFYPRPICPHCWSDALEWREASGRARLKSFSEVWKPGHPGWAAVTPFFVGLVTLEEGPTMLSQILTGESRVRIGDGLVFSPRQVGGRVLPFFQQI